MNTALPATVIGGYLGAGKTTLVNNLLRQANGKRLAILVNEFGSLPIDQDLIEAQDDEMITISGGCICCSFGSDLTEALIKLSEISPQPDHVVIEASGVAMPGAIGSSIIVLDRFQLNGIVVLADSTTILDQANDEYIGDTIERQIIDADLIMQTKSDLITSAQSAHLNSWISKINGKAHIVQSSFGNIAMDVVLSAAKIPKETAVSAHSDADYRSVSFNPSSFDDPKELAKTLVRGGFGIIRAKGFVRDHQQNSFLIQIVGNQIDVSEASAQNDPALVCIGHVDQLDVNGLEELFQDEHSK